MPQAKLAERRAAAPRPKSDVCSVLGYMFAPPGLGHAYLAKPQRRLANAAQEPLEAVKASTVATGSCGAEGCAEREAGTTYLQLGMAGQHHLLAAGNCVSSAALAVAGDCASSAALMGGQHRALDAAACVQCDTPDQSLDQSVTVQSYSGEGSVKQRWAHEPISGHDEEGMVGKDEQGGVGVALDVWEQDVPSLRLHRFYRCLSDFDEIELEE